MRRTGGDAVALPLLEQAYEVALAARQHFIAVDAAHSCALAGDMIAWTNRGLELANRFKAARYWRGTLLLNLGDWQWEHGEPAKSLATFEAALEAREQEARNPSLTEEARYGIARALRALGRPLDAVPLLEQAVRWVKETGFEQPVAREYRSSPQPMTTSADTSKPQRSAQRLHGHRTDPSLREHRRTVGQARVLPFVGTSSHEGVGSLPPVRRRAAG